MAICTPKRIYNEEALESWLKKVSAYDWESTFTPQELSLGREIYRNGEIRELEIHEYDAIVHAKFDQEECYTLIEWNKGQLTTRGSTKDKLLARALAAAGLYDIEELVSDEASPLPPGKKKSAIPAKKDEKVSLVESILAQRKKATARALRIDFSTSTKGLMFKAVWKDVDGKFTAALKSSNYSPGDTNEFEREKLINMANLARKAGYKFNSKGGFYILSDLEKVQDFFLKEFDSKWQEKFCYELDEGSCKLSNGIQNAEVVVDLEGGQNGTLDFCWNMQISDEVLTAEEARQLIKNAGKPIILSRMGLAQLEEEKLELLATWKRWLNLYSDGNIPRYVLFSLFGEEPITLTLSSELTTWRKSLFGKPKLSNRELPDFLRPYQAQGVRWLEHICEKNCHGLLADEMGLGKTVQILSFLNTRDIYDLPNLIVCPASVVPVWQREIQRFYPAMKVEILKSGNDFYKRNDKVLWIASYAQLRIHKYLLDSLEFGYVVLDEAQLIKNPEAKVTQACMCIRGKHRIILTGTPLENKYLDLWTIFRFLMPGLLGTRKNFESMVVSEGIAIREKIKKQIAPFVLRRTKKDVLKELPGKTEIECICPLTAIQKEEYNRLTQDGVEQLGEDIPKAFKERSLSFLTLLTRLRQACCDPSLLPWVDNETEESGKINVLMAKLSEVLASNHKVVIFSQFVTFLDRINRAIKREFSDIPIFHLTGKTLDRAKPVSDFQNLEGAGVFLVSLRAGGTGITLHSADYVFLMDPWWNPAVEEQAIDRVHRLGQDKPVFVYRMVTPGTVESRIQQLKQDKKGLFTGILGGMSDISDIRNYYESLSQLISLLPDDNK